MPQDSRPPLPVIILTGFLGAGKTTLLQRILSQKNGPRYGVLVNDFGAINIDADLITETGRDGVVSLENGCICCTIRDDLVAALHQILEQPNRPERLVIEASGVSRPLQIVEALEDPEIEPQTLLDGVYCLIDCGAFLDLDFASTELAMDQVMGSDLAILNKSDLADDAQMEQIETVLRTAQPRLKTLRTTGAVVPNELLAGLPDPVASGLVDHDECADPSCGCHDHHHDHHHDHAHDHTHAHDHDHDHTHNEEFRSWSWQGTGRFAASDVKSFMAALPPQILRAKGILVGPEGERLRCDLVGKRHSVKREDAAAPALSTFVLIGRSEALDPDALTAGFEAMKC
ncbi:GTP-binding protein [Rhodobacteraceae bacterium D3-12]|nr:GTP-binding protein [Rhodobacteraceae bacterium D3-12]